MIDSLRKDFASLKSNALLIGVLLFCWLVIFVPMGNLSFLAAMVSIFCTLMGVLRICADLGGGQVRFKGDKPPLRGAQMAVSKYLFVLILMVIGVLLTMAGGMLLCDVMHKLTNAEAWTSVALAVTCSTFFAALLLPLAFAFGPKYLRTILYAGFGVPFLAAMILAYWGRLSLAVTPDGTVAPGLVKAMVVCVCLFVVSQVVSIFLAPKE